MMNSFLFKRGEYFYLEYFDENSEKKRRISTGCTTKSGALKFLTDFKKNKRERIHRTKTLYEFAAEYEAYVKRNLSIKYYNNIRCTMKQFKEHAGDISLRKINSRLMEFFISDSYERAEYAGMQNYKNLRSAFNKAISWNYISENPLKKVPIPRIATNNPLFITEEELNIIMSADPNPDLRDIYLFAFHTGMRRGEIINVRWNHVNLKEGLIRVINSDEFTTKSRKERVVPINRTLLALLNRMCSKRKSDTELLFQKDGVKFQGNYISKSFKKSVRATDINHEIHFHDLRHSFASNIVKKGVSIVAVKELLGHKDLKTTQVYMHLSIDSLKDAVRVLESE